jgi:hypothetical protein
MMQETQSEGEGRQVSVVWSSYLLMLDAFINSTQAIVDDLKQFTFELRLEHAIDRWIRNGDVTGIYAFFGERRFSTTGVGRN